MGLDVYLSWDGGSYKDSQDVQDGDGPDWYDEPFEHGQRGQFRGWHWKELFMRCTWKPKRPSPIPQCQAASCSSGG